MDSVVHGVAKNGARQSDFHLYFQSFPGGSEDKDPARSSGDVGSIPGLGRSPGDGNDYPLQYSSRENSMDSIVHGVAKNWT